MSRNLGYEIFLRIEAIGQSALFIYAANKMQFRRALFIAAMYFATFPRL